MTRVLCVDDESQILRALQANLEIRHFDVVLARTGEEALELASRLPPDAVILDLGLPGIGGMEVVRGLRGWTSAPIIVLSARDDEQGKIDALDAGANDYVTKPFGMGELLARLRAALRNDTPSASSPLITTDSFTLDLGQRRATNAAGDVRLTPIEWRLVEVLVRHEGKLVTSRQLLQLVWGPSYGTETNYLRVHMAHVRRKLELDSGHPTHFVTEPGIGYRFVP